MYRVTMRRYRTTGDHSSVPRDEQILSIDEFESREEALRFAFGVLGRTGEGEIVTPSLGAPGASSPVAVGGPLVRAGTVNVGGFPVPDYVRYSAIVEEVV